MGDGVIPILSAFVNAFNLLVTFAFLVYVLRLRRLFSGGVMAKAMRLLVASASLTFLAVATRAFVIWFDLQEPYLTVELLFRSGGFLTLFAFAQQTFRAWTSLGK